MTDTNMLEDLIYQALEELNPELLDDDMPDAMIDYEKRSEAIDLIIKDLNAMREN